ncbi:type IV secretion system DNA-binding domain-containing protein [Candidatus Peregrinibacteria bacterium]|nr:type IV secretion system DNA-binding domain-containing protein [Candidatus Peregrinibacteria bacterium]
MVTLLIRVPREDSEKDSQKKEEKDFKEKIGVMEQFYRNMHELSELSLGNIIRTTLFNSNIISFEMIAHNKKIDFYISTPDIYQHLIEKQLTSYYPTADIQPVDRVVIQGKGNKLRMYFAYMKRPYWFPLKTYKHQENDPLNDLTNIFSKLEEDETAGIQLTFRPIKSRKYNKKIENNASILFKGKEIPKFNIPGFNFIYNLFAGVIGGYDKMRFEKPGDQTGFVRMLQPKEEAAKKMGEKAGNPSYRLVVRYFGSAKTTNRCVQITDNVNLALNMYKDEYLNWFQSRRIFFIDKINNAIMKFNFKNRLIDTGFWIFGEYDNIVSPEELASLYHLPCSRYNHTPIINWLDYKVLPAPVETPSEGVLLGYNVYRGYKREVRMLRKDRTRHHYCIGKSGAGKSAFLSYVARQDIWNGDGVGVIDPHGDLIEELVQFVPKERAKDVIVYDPADYERPMGLNILEADSPEQMDMASSQATEIFIKLFGDEIFGPRIQHYFRNGCLTLMEDTEEGATLIDVPRLFVDDEFMKYKVSKVKNPVVRSFWDHEYAHTGDRERQEMIPYFSSKFGPFITNSIMRNTIGQTKSAFNFREVMDKKKILLVNLSKGKIGDLNTQLLGLVLVARIQMAAMSRVDIPESERHDFYLYVDEFQNFSTDSFCSILSEARKYHLALIMANQYIKQLEKKNDTSIRDAVFGNVGTMMSFKVGADDAEYLSKEYAPLLTEQDIIGIANYKAYIKLNIKNTTSRPFSLETIYDMSKANKKVGDIIKQYSRIKYGRKKEFVDQEIKARIGIDI